MSKPEQELKEAIEARRAKDPIAYKIKIIEAEMRGIANACLNNFTGELFIRFTELEKELKELKEQSK